MRIWEKPNVMKIEKDGERGEEFPFGLWNKDEIEQRETQTKSKH